MLSSSYEGDTVVSAGVNGSGSGVGCVEAGGHDIIDLQLRRTFVAHVKVAKVVPLPPSHQGKPLELQAGGC